MFNNVHYESNIWNISELLRPNTFEYRLDYRFLREMCFVINTFIETIIYKNRQSVRTVSQSVHSVSLHVIERNFVEDG